MRKFLDNLYRVSGGLAALSILVLFLIVLTQIITRYLGIVIPGLSAYATYAMASSYFFGLGYAIYHSSHISVSLIVDSLGRYKRIIEIVALLFSVCVACGFAIFAVKNTYLSFVTHEVSQSQDATPLWIPQLSMAFGTLIFAVSVLDLCLKLLLKDSSFGESSIQELSKEEG